MLQLDYTKIQQDIEKERGGKLSPEDLRLIQNLILERTEARTTPYGLPTTLEDAVISLSIVDENINEGDVNCAIDKFLEQENQLNAQREARLIQRGRYIKNLLFSGVRAVGVASGVTAAYLLFQLYRGPALKAAITGAESRTERLAIENEGLERMNQKLIDRIGHSSSPQAKSLPVNAPPTQDPSLLTDIIAQSSDDHFTPKQTEYIAAKLLDEDMRELFTRKIIYEGIVEHNNQRVKLQVRLRSRLLNDNLYAILRNPDSNSIIAVLRYYGSVHPNRIDIHNMFSYIIFEGPTATTATTFTSSMDPIFEKVSIANPGNDNHWRITRTHQIPQLYSTFPDEVRELFLRSYVGGIAQAGSK